MEEDANITAEHSIRREEPAQSGAVCDIGGLAERCGQVPSETTDLSALWRWDTSNKTSGHMAWSGE
jgi:hypothetical protein